MHVISSEVILPWKDHLVEFGGSHGRGVKENANVEKQGIPIRLIHVILAWSLGIWRA